VGVTRVEDEEKGMARAGGGEHLSLCARGFRRATKGGGGGSWEREGGRRGEKFRHGWGGVLLFGILAPSGPATVAEVGKRR